MHIAHGLHKYCHTDFPITKFTEKSNFAKHNITTIKSRNSIINHFNLQFLYLLRFMFLCIKSQITSL